MNSKRYIPFSLIIFLLAFVIRADAQGSEVLDVDELVSQKVALIMDAIINLGDESQSDFLYLINYSTELENNAGSAQIDAAYGGRYTDVVSNFSELGEITVVNGDRVAELDQVKMLLEQALSDLYAMDNVEQRTFLTNVNLYDHGTAGNIPTGIMIQGDNVTPTYWVWDQDQSFTFKPSYLLEREAETGHIIAVQIVGAEITYPNGVRYYMSVYGETRALPDGTDYSEALFSGGNLRLPEDEFFLSVLGNTPGQFQPPENTEYPWVQEFMSNWYENIRENPVADIEAMQEFEAYTELGEALIELSRLDWLENEGILTNEHLLPEASR